MEINHLIRGVRFVRPEDHSFPERPSIDLRVQQGEITEVGSGLELREGETLWEAEIGAQFYMSSSWMDLFSVVTDPGFEWKESYVEWSDQAAAGGFGECLVIPETNPSADKGEIIRSLCRRENVHGVKMSVAAAVTAGKQGKQLAELRDCFEAGAKVFSEGLHASLSSARMRIALEYVHGFGGKLFSFPQDAGLAENGQIHEGKSSLATGLNGISSLSESLMVYRDSELALMTGTEVHFCGISCAESVEILRKAMDKGAPISASVFSTHLIFTEEDTESFDSAYKVMPPFRSMLDREALRRAVAEGVIQGIASGHVPSAPEEKNLEFPYASFGRRNLSDSFRYAWAALVATGLMTDSELIERMVVFPRELVGNTSTISTFSFWKVDKNQSVTEIHLFKNSTGMILPF